MRKRTSLILLTTLLLLLIVLPVLVTQLIGTGTRHLHGVSLKDVDYQEVIFHNLQQDLKLGGMLFVPEGQGPFPAVVIIQGSGTSQRDNPWYLTLTDYLQKNGIVVLVPDKRGSEQSEGDWHIASFEDLATDTLAAISFLKKQEQVPISSIGIVGMSQGGYFAPLVATESSDIDFLVDVVGASVPIYDLILYEENHNLRQMGFLPGLSRLISYGSTFYLKNVGQRDFWKAVGNFDPIPYWEKVTIPALVLYGQEDTNVPATESAARLRSLEKPNIEVIIYEGSGHALEDPEGKGDRIFREDALKKIRDFIFSVTSPPQRT